MRASSVTLGKRLADGFEGGIPQTHADVTEAMRHGLLSLDANVLLNFYRYSPKARDALMNVLMAAEDRVWVSHQAAREFWRNRVRAVDDRSEASSLMLEALDRAERALRSSLDVWVKQTALAKDGVVDVRGKVDAFFGDFRNVVAEESAELASISYDTHADSVVGMLSSLLDGHVGPKMSPEGYKSAVELGGQRVEQKIPPGFRDKDKGESSLPEGAAGDYLVWHQSLLAAKHRGIPLVIVTGDEKEDWWWRHRGQFMGPRPELAAECLAEVGQQLYMMRPVDLISYASSIDVAVEDEARADVEDASEGSAAARWTETAIAELFTRLDGEGAVQTKIIRFAAHQGGSISRKQVFQLAGYDEDRMLKGFTRPTARITRRLQSEGLVDEGVQAVLTPRYYGGVSAEEFQIPAEFISAIAALSTQE